MFAVAIFSFRKTNLMKVQTYNAAEVSGSVVCMGWWGHVCLRVEVVLDIGMSEWAWDEVSDYGIACVCVCALSLCTGFNYMCMFACACLHTCMYVYVCVCVCVCVCVHVEVVLDIGMSEWA